MKTATRKVIGAREHYRVLSVLNDFSGRRPETITVGALARRAGVSPERAVQVLNRRYGRKRAGR